MIRLLKGSVASTEERSLILLVQDTGYQVFVPKSLLLSDQDTALTLHIHTHVREDEISLYGFSKPQELKFFELLLTVSGVGPKMALEILNEPVEEMQKAILQGQTLSFTKISGIGKKIAERIILELKGKMEKIWGPNANENASGPISQKEISEDILHALENLGYKRQHIQKTLSRMDEGLESEEEIVRYFLQNA